MKEDLLDELLRHVAKDEASAINDCLSGNIECDSDEILDVLSSYEVRSLLNPGNMNEVFTMLAHNEIVQKPHYITRRWGAILQPLCNINIDDLYEKLEPSMKKVLGMLKCEPTNDSERMVIVFLKKVHQKFGSFFTQTFSAFYHWITDLPDSHHKFYRCGRISSKTNCTYMWPRSGNTQYISIFSRIT